ncbi:MAG: sigma-70 family RNA polymerase sigma factor [Chloroflexi bacterium]|nr:MAG: sigma-70 family RNA polymerase sigma factor [Chloroflexota bacterium]
MEPENHSANDSKTLYTNCQSRDYTIQANAYRQLWSLLYPIAYFIVRDQPEGEAIAQDCAQKALIRIHQRITECREPQSFIGWSRQIVRNIARDELRRRKRLRSLTPPAEDEMGSGQYELPDSSRPTVENLVLDKMSTEALQELIAHASVLSERSRRVIIGRYFEARTDEELAQQESEGGETAVRPSHIQVTRAKNMRKLRAWLPPHYKQRQ